ncbi:MAG: hypothetical protein J6S49_04450 [Erysipelotrichaceae bacterium]|nr:hypothetical protein [Erysipelotrichaceae bacterium]
MSEKDPHRYDDIIDLPRFESQGRKKMSNYDRAAQFAPFDALDGYDEAMSETARTTESELILSENELQILNRKFEILTSHLKEVGEVEITYFQPDLYKDGGFYQDKKITIKRIDLTNRLIITYDNEKYSLDYISDIRSPFITRYLEGFE